MTDLSTKTALVVDHGAFIEFAFRLARDFGHVYYYAPWEEAFSKVDTAVIGDGFRDVGVERVKEPWGVIDKGLVDIAVFPDVHHAEMQLHIEKLGLPVWGARTGDLLELNKLRFKQIQDELGLLHAEYDVLHGLEALREYCRDPKNADRWIKPTPQFRGTRETKHHLTYEASRQWLDALGAELDAIAEAMVFLCEHPIKAPFEGGIDTYTVDGKVPNIAVQGYERKDQCYFAAVQAYDQIPKEITSTLEPLLPILGQRGAKQMLSTEVKITDSEPKLSYLLEPTVRQPSPAGEEQFELYNNFSQIVWEGAHGNLVDPVPTAKFACEAMVAHDGDDTVWRSLSVPDSVRRWVKLYNLCKVGDRLLTAPGCDVIGAVVGIGDTPKEALEHLKENAEALKDQPVTIHVEALAGIISQIEQAEDEGLHFSNEPLPKPAEAIEET